MTTTQEESFNDEVTLFAHTSGQDSLGQLVDSFDSGTVIDAGLSTEKEFRNYRGELVTIDADAVLRVAYGQAVAVADKVVGRGETYMVDGLQEGRNVQIVALRKVKV